MLANRIRGDLAFTVGEGDAAQEYVLNFACNGLVALEERLDLKVDQIARLFERDMSMTHLRACFWAGMQEHQEGISEKEVGRIMAELGPGEAGQLVTRAFIEAFPQAAAGEGGDEADPPKPPAGSGSGSTAAG